MKQRVRWASCKGEQQNVIGWEGREEGGRFRDVMGGQSYTWLLWIRCSTEALSWSWGRSFCRAGRQWGRGIIHFLLLQRRNRKQEVGNWPCSWARMVSASLLVSEFRVCSSSLAADNISTTSVGSWNTLRGPTPSPETILAALLQIPHTFYLIQQQQRISAEALSSSKWGLLLMIDNDRLFNSIYYS